MARKKPEKNEEIRGRTLGEEVQAGLNAGISTPVHSGAEPLAGHFPVPRTSAPVTVAPSSAPLTLAPSQGSISGILSARGLFERNFRKKGQKVKNSVIQTSLGSPLYVPSESILEPSSDSPLSSFFFFENRSGA